jgi:hypothetical protein
MAIYTKNAAVYLPGATGNKMVNNNNNCDAAKSLRDKKRAV